LSIFTTGTALKFMDSLFGVCRVFTVAVLKSTLYMLPPATTYMTVPSLRRYISVIWLGAKFRYGVKVVSALSVFIMTPL
jgi:hypothetical protein